jgi:serralysin
MRFLDLTLFSVIGRLALLVGCLFPAALAQAYEANDRWGTTATNGSTGSMGSPIILTWSIVKDGVKMPGAQGGLVDSGLIGFLDGLLGAGPGGNDYTQRPWFTHFEQSFARLSELSGVTYVYEPKDDGATISGSVGGRGHLGVRGDVRIGGRSYGPDSSTLASNYYPDFGDMMINIDKGSFYANPANDFRSFRNIIMHEAMHGLGIGHVESAGKSFLMEPFIDTSFDGPQLDDILGLHRLYGDVWEKGAGNNTAANATSLGTLAIGTPLRAGGDGANLRVEPSDVNFLSIDDDSDVDVFKFTLDSRLQVNLNLFPLGNVYSVGPQGGTETMYDTTLSSNLSLELLGSNGATVLQTANGAPAGFGESIVFQLDAGTYYARVRGTANEVQFYQLLVQGANAPEGTLRWVGDVDGNWNVGGSENFTIEGAKSKFYPGMVVEFDDSSTTKDVRIVQHVSPASLLVKTETSYKFSGPGGIISGDLTIDGGGDVELANSGNSYAGPTTVESGTLRITGNANAMASPIEIKSGGKVILAAADATYMSSVITIRAGGELQVGLPTTNTNTLPNVHPGIVNEGILRVLDAEEINHVTGSGAIIVESEVATLSNNLGYDGPITIGPDAGAKLLNAAAVGSNFGATTVQNGGFVELAENMVTGEPFHLSGSGNGQGALRVAANRQATLNGPVTAGAESTRIQLESSSQLTIAGPFDASAADQPVQFAVPIGSQVTLPNGLQAASGVSISGGGNVSIGGSVALGGTSEVAAGKLALSGPGQLAGDFHVAAGATLAVSGGHTFAPSATLSGGGLVQGTFNFPGRLAPGASAGAIAVEGNLALAGTLAIELGGELPQIQYDQLHIMGSGALGGTLEVSLLNNFAPTLGDVFTIVTGTKPLAGTFSTLILPELGGGFGWRLNYLSNAVQLSVNSIGISVASDFNSDGFVDSGDLNVWKQGFGMAANASRHLGDADGDGAITGADFLLWQRQRGAGSVIGAAAAVPEPAAWVLAIAGVVPWAARRFRRNN